MSIMTHVYSNTCLQRHMSIATRVYTQLSQTLRHIWIWILDLPGTVYCVVGYNSFSRFIISGMAQDLLDTNAFSAHTAEQSFTIGIMPQAPFPRVEMEQKDWRLKLGNKNQARGQTAGLPLGLLAENPQLHLHFQLRWVFLPLLDCGQPRAGVAKGGLL